MNLVSLNLDSISPTYIPELLIEGYESLIWTERFNTPGEFSMVVSENIENMVSALPYGSLISHLDTQEVMIVENHDIKINDQGVAQDTVTGRSVTSFLENRIMLDELITSPGSSDARYFQPTRSVEDNIALLIHDQVVNAPVLQSYVSGHGDTGKNILNVSVSNTSRTSVTGFTVSIDAGEDVLSIITQYLSNANFGLRMIRPVSHGSHNRITFAVTPNSTAPAIYTTIGDDATLRFDIYDGLDRSAGQSTVPVVIFDYSVGDVIDPEYLLSNKGYKNVAYVRTPSATDPGGGYKLDTYDGDPSPPSGWAGFARREVYYDLTGTVSPDPSDPDFPALLKAMQQLSLTRSKVFFDGEIKDTSTSYKYKTDYFLGDRVTLQAQYGVQTTMQVSEFIRTEDSNGDRGYPTLTAFNV